MRTSAGSRPGDSLADAGFFFLFSWVLKQVATSLKHEGWLQPIPWSPEMRNSFLTTPGADSSVWPLDVVWMDDLCLL